jgi:hypothetical protein
MDRDVPPATFGSVDKSAMMPKTLKNQCFSAL